MKNYEDILENTFDTNQLSWDEVVTLTGEVVEANEMKQKLIGKIASSIGSKYGEKRLHKLSQDIENSYGMRIPVATIRSYRWVYDKLLPIIDSLPKDWNYRAWKTLASMEKPGEWVEKAIQEGWSGIDLVNEIKSSKGEKPPKTCPQCGAFI